MRPKGKNGDINPKENPVALNDHGVDALRYLIYSLKVAYGILGNVATAKTSQVEKEYAGRTNVQVNSRFGGGSRRQYGSLSDRGMWRRI